MITPKKSRKKFLRFGIIKIEKDEFPHYKSPFFSENVDTDKVLVSKKYSFSEKKKKKKKNVYTSLVTCNGSYKITPFSIILLKTSACVKCFDGC